MTELDTMKFYHKERVAIWGTGKMAMKFYYQMKSELIVECFYDNDQSKVGISISGIKVVQNVIYGGGKNCNCINCMERNFYAVVKRRVNTITRFCTMFIL